MKYSSSLSAVRYSILSVTLAVLNFSVRRFYKPVVVDAGVGRKRSYKADVRAFRGFYGAYTAVMSVDERRALQIRRVFCASLRAQELKGVFYA